MSNEEEEKKTVENTLLNSEEEKVEIGNKSFLVEPLVRAEYKPLMGMFAQLIMGFDLEILDNVEDNVGTLINIISEEALMELYLAHINKGLDKEIDSEWVNENMTMAQEMQLFTSICKVNNIEQMVENFTQTIQALGAIREATGKTQEQN